MTRALLLVFAVLWLADAHAAGTKKKRLFIYVRRELVPATQATPPAELHRPSENYHELRCRTAGWGCGWRIRPQLFTRQWTLESIDRRVAELARSKAAGTPVSQGTFELENFGVYYRNLSTGGYEYYIVEGGDKDGEMDALILAAELRESGGKRVRATVGGKPFGD